VVLVLLVVQVSVVQAQVLVHLLEHLQPPEQQIVVLVAAVAEIIQILYRVQLVLQVVLELLLLDTLHLN